MSRPVIEYPAGLCALLRSRVDCAEISPSEWREWKSYTIAASGNPRAARVAPSNTPYVLTTKSVKRSSAPNPVQISDDMYASSEAWSRNL